MPTTQSQAHISVQALIDAADQLNSKELEAVTDRLLVMRAARRWPHLSSRETTLLLEINTPLPDETWRRYSHLYSKLEPLTLTEEEHTELLGLIDVVEEDNAHRIELLVELAQLRGTTLDTQMKLLGIGPRSHA